MPCRTSRASCAKRPAPGTRPTSRASKRRSRKHAGEKTAGRLRRPGRSRPRRGRRRRDATPQREGDGGDRQRRTARRERPAGYHRHPARGSRGRLRWRRRSDADDRSARRRGIALRNDLRPCAADAPLSRVAADRRVSIRQWRPRQRIVSFRRPSSHAREHVESSRVPCRRVRRRLRARCALRVERRLRRLRRQVRVAARRRRTLGAGAACGQSAGRRRELDHEDRRPRRRQSAMVRMGAPLRST